jgi:hypothetical protein
MPCHDQGSGVRRTPERHAQGHAGQASLGPPLPPGRAADRQRLDASASSFRLFAIIRTNPMTSANSTRNCLTDFAPFRRLSPFLAAMAFPSSARGPVAFVQGRLRRANWRRRSRPAVVIGPRLVRFLRPAATRRGLGGSFGHRAILAVTSQFGVKVIFRFASVTGSVSATSAADPAVDEGVSTGYPTTQQQAIGIMFSK